ncbi:MAG: cation:proton antiporter [Candidatus Omnitrophota bacterium]
MIFKQIHNIFSGISLTHLNILLLLGISLFGGTIGGRVFQKLKVPQVVGYMIIGIIAGRSGLNFIHRDVVNAMQPLSYFALGLIGFMIGGELKTEVFRKYGKKFLIILFAEGMGAFFAVFIFVGVIGTYFFGNPVLYWTLGLLLGAIASATAPAATTDVLWEYKTRGPLTSTVLGIVALDDALALILFAAIASIAGKLLGKNTGGLFLSIMRPVYQIAASIIIGTLSGLALSGIIKKQVDKEKILALSVGTVLLVLGISLTMDVDMLLAAMSLGAVLVNFTPKRSEEIFKLVSGFAAPIYVLFFVLVGAKLEVGQLNLATMVIVGVYLMARTVGKMLGADFGARVSKSPKTVRENLKFCLFSQAGVAIGLSIASYRIFPGEIGNSIVVIVTASTFFLQLIGPVCTKIAITRANEIGLDVKEDDLIRRTSARDIMDTDPVLVSEDMCLTGILDIFRNTEVLYYPVINREKRLLGAITVESIRQTFMETESGAFLLAHDLMESAALTVTPDMPMVEVKELFDKYKPDSIPVISGEGKVEGIIERRVFDKFISTKMMELERQLELLSRT